MLIQHLDLIQEVEKWLTQAYPGCPGKDAAKRVSARLSLSS